MCAGAMTPRKSHKGSSTVLEVAGDELNNTNIVHVEILFLRIK